jgi:hypothetical protein
LLKLEEVRQAIAYRRKIITNAFCDDEVVLDRQNAGNFEQRYQNEPSTARDVCNDDHDSEQSTYSGIEVEQHFH